jgi:hypothetical protein
MRRRIPTLVTLVLFAALGIAACEKGPMQKAGDRIDRITDQDKVIGKGPAEKAGKEVDNAVRDIKR